MAQAYQLIQAITLTSSTASVTFSNIPQTYTDLIVKTSLRSDRVAVPDGLKISFNGSPSGTSYTTRYIEGTGSTAGSGLGVNGGNALEGWDINAANSTTSTFSNVEIYIPNYTSSNYKSISTDNVMENNATAGYQILMAGLWSNTSAITSMNFTSPTSSNWVTGSTFYLYGIGGARASGGTITADSKYTYHTFTSSGTFTALEKIKNAEVLVIAGGGSAYNGSFASTTAGSGGGAGGLVGAIGQTFNAGTSFTALVGAGGAVNGNNGSNSQFGSLTVAIGGGHGNNIGGAGSSTSGGSGGGGGFALAGSSGTAGQGNAGGTGTSGGGFNQTGGGGGAGGVGGDATQNVRSGNGGIGSSAYSAWGYATNTGHNVGGIYYYAGGAGGVGQGGYSYAGVGGAGGGGTPASNSTGTNGLANTGGGGAGSDTAGQGLGGSGLVIIRYPN